MTLGVRSEHLQIGFTLVLGQPDQRVQAPVRGRLRDRRPAPSRPARAATPTGGGAAARRSPTSSAGSASSSSERIASSCRCAARAVRTRFASSAFASRFASRAVAATTACSSSAQRRLARAREREQVADRLVPLRVGDRVRAPLGDAQRDALARGDVGEELARRRARSRPQLEMRVARARERAARRAARRAGRRRGSTSGRRRASAAARAARRDAESTPASRSTAERALVDVDVELVARRPVERAAAVGADLRADAEVAQQRERAARGGRAREVEVDGDAACPRRCQAPATWKSAESSASRQQRRARRDRGELVAQLVRERHSVTPSSASSRRL